MTDKMEIRVRGVDKLEEYFRKIPVEARKVVVKESATYLMGDERHGLRHLAPYRYVSRKAAYGVTFFTEKQRRWFWAAVKSGEIQFPSHYIRTGQTAGSWRYVTTGGGYGARLENPSKGAPWVMGDDTQARQPAMVGHRKTSEVIENNMKGAIHAGNLALNRWLKENNP